jgi:hypothetical protein
VAAVAIAVAIAALLALVLGAGGSSAGNSGSGAIVEHGSATPEDAVKLFAEAFAEGDMETAASAFATTSMVDGYSFKASVERVGAVSAWVWLPAEDYRSVDLARRTGDVGVALTYVTRSALMPQEEQGVTYALTSEGDLSADDFVAGLDPAGFSEISVKELTVFTFAEGGKAEENQQKSSAIYGAESSRTASVLFDTADGTKMLGLQVIEYDGAWYVWMLGAPIVGANTNALESMSPSEYRDMVAWVESTHGES